ncbi:hypothetical protein [Oceaniradius stylonematis]|uniref:hypothetical protein n=1 Tax=Oceaniradius stylonematis TaxID=2184161 RepID=UPI00274006F8|nr:hypothetical protein [Oceaniradius stylonematis]
MTFQVIASFSNRESLCIGEITASEAELARESDPAIDGYGLYLMSVDNRNPTEPASVLAKFNSEDAARKLASFFRLSGKLEAA